MLKFDKKLIEIFFLSTLLILIISIIVFLTDNIMGLTVLIFGDIDKAADLATDCFYTEVSAAFITLSLSTVLTSESKRVYWTSMYEHRLINPFFTNFRTLSACVLAALTDGIIWFVVDKVSVYSGVICIFLSFVLVIFLLILLALRMIDANFGREQVKKELEDMLRRKKESRPFGYDIGKDQGENLEEVNKLVQVTIQEMEGKDIDLVVENMDLLSKLNYRNEISRLYKCAKEVIGSEEVLAVLDFKRMLMHSAIRNNDDGFFYSGCPIPEKEQFSLWEKCIHDVFDEAVFDWKSGRKEEARKKRTDLYVILTKYLYFRMIWSEHTGYEDEEDDETQYEINKNQYEIIMLMGLFVYRRKNKVIGGMPATEGLDKEWYFSEHEDAKKIFDEELAVIREDAPQTEHTLDYLIKRCEEIMQEWEENDDALRRYCGDVKEAAYEKYQYTKLFMKEAKEY